MIAEDDPRLKFVPIEHAIVPPSGIIEHIKDNWWAVHPDKGLVFWTAGRQNFPQCNGDERLSKHLWKMYPWAQVERVPSVFRRINVSDYAP